jgi:hypothetical protein
MGRRKAVKSRLLSGNSGFRWIFVDDSTDANDPIQKSALSASLPGGGQERLLCTPESALSRLRPVNRTPRHDELENLF